MKEIYQSYAMNFCGCFDRESNYYWENWVKKETPKFLIIKEKQSRKIIGFLGARYCDENDRLMIKDFSINIDNYNRDYGEKLFSLLVTEWISKYSENKTNFSVHLPTAICSNWKEIISKELFVDPGVMYRAISTNSEKDNSTIEIDTKRHLFWSTDNF